MKKSFSDSDIQRIKELETKRIKNEYKPGWTYYQAKTLGMLEAFYYLQSKGEIGVEKQKNSVEKLSLAGKKLLTVELVPQSCWFSNVRTNISEDDWNYLKKITSSKAGYKCEICSSRGPKWPVECHEVWEYDDISKVQLLIRLIALCPLCHEVKHIGFANINGRGDYAASHLAEVNDWPLEKTYDYINRQFRLWEERSNYSWKLDISWLEKYGINFVEHERMEVELTKNVKKSIVSKLWSFFYKLILIIVL